MNIKYIFNWLGLGGFVLVRRTDEFYESVDFRKTGLATTNQDMFKKDTRLLVHRCPARLVSHLIDLLSQLIMVCPERPGDSNISIEDMLSFHGQSSLCPRLG
jgi:hypothetical protein